MKKGNYQQSNPPDNLNTETQRPLESEHALPTVENKIEIG